MEGSSLISVSFVLASAVVLAAGCALGGDGINPRSGRGVRLDGGSLDAGSLDAGEPPLECVPACEGGATCRGGRCVDGAVDADEDGVPASSDCDDSDPEVGAEAQRLCVSACGEGILECTAGVWGECSAPAECACELGAAPREVPCGRCGVQRQACVAGDWADEGGCEGEGVCAPEALESRSGTCGACGEGTRVDTRRCASSCTWGSWVTGSCATSATCSPGTTDRETRACTTSCGGTQTRSRSCSSSSCTWGAWGSWSACPTCATCGDGVCNGSETCSTCADCQYGHLGTGENNDSCAGVPAETWRCVRSARLGGNVSQVCRSGVWTNFNLNPQACSSCVCRFSTSCCQAGSTSTGCR